MNQVTNRLVSATGPHRLEFGQVWMVTFYALQGHWVSCPSLTGRASDSIATQIIMRLAVGIVGENAPVKLTMTEKLSEPDARNEKGLRWFSADACPIATSSFSLLKESSEIASLLSGRKCADAIFWAAESRLATTPMLTREEKKKRGWMTAAWSRVEEKSRLISGASH